MAQIGAVTGMPRFRRNQTAELNARLPFLYQTMQQKSQQEFQDEQIKDLAARRKLEEARFGLEQGQFGLAQQELGLKERGVGLQEKGMGIQERGLDVEKSKLAQSEREFGWQQTQAEKARELQSQTEQREMGVKAAGMGFTALNTLGKSATLGSITAKAGDLWNGLFDKEAPVNIPKTTGLYGLNVGAMAGGGLLGFGAGQAFGGQNKLKKAAIGVGVGGLASMLAGGGDWGAGIGGGLLGGIGGLLM